MRLLVLGSSSSVGTGLADPSLAWPWIVERELPARVGEPVELEHTVIYPVGPNAVPRAKAAVERFNPDVIVFSYGAYAAAVETVALRFRNLFGERVYRLFRKAERRFDSSLGGHASKRTPLGRAVRRVARRTFGVAAVTSFEELAGIQAEIVHWLSRREGATVLTYGEPDMPQAQLHANPKANLLLARARELIGEISLAHHFLIVDCGAAFDAEPDRDGLFGPDAVHKSVRGHRLQADVLMATLLSPPSPFAPEAAARRAAIR